MVNGLDLTNSARNAGSPERRKLKFSPLLCRSWQNHSYLCEKSTLTLIKSISGFRGTIGGRAGDNLTPVDVVECTAAYGAMLLDRKTPKKIVIGRDARPSGAMVSQLAGSTLTGMGFEVIDLGLSTTPTVEMAVPALGAGGGIIITASHNPKTWNALKFLNHSGDFISREDGIEILQRLEQGGFEFAGVDELGRYELQDGWIDRHIDAILALEYIDVEAIKKRSFTVVVDPVNSTGALAIPPLLEKLGCRVILINGEVSGQFAHNPEPLPQHLQDLCTTVLRENADLGIAVDPDVDRLALVDENGLLFGEEYTLVAAADFILSRKKGNTVSNLSSTRALSDLTHTYGTDYFASAVGEVNVVEKMKAVGAVIGGEGNGGVILPDLHYGRDALAGTALILARLTELNTTLSALRKRYPDYQMVKDKMELTPDLDIDGILSGLEKRFAGEQINTEDGLKLDFERGWVHLRKSNTEPIIRIYAESDTDTGAKNLVDLIKTEMKMLITGRNLGILNGQ